MSIVIRKYEQKDIEQMNCIWNEVVDDGIAFPQLEILDDKTGEEFFSPQTYCGVAEDDESGANCRALYFAPKQYRTVRTYCKSKLCRKFKIQRTKNRQNAC